ncbi:MAG: glycoside hydrolase family 26 protein [Nocardioidaceae bacterium]
MLSRRGLVALAAVAAVLLAGALAILFVGDGGEAASDTGSGPTPSVPTETTSVLPALARGPQPPDQGAWVGAWVKPSLPTQSGLVAGVASFEQAIGRPLDVVQVYHQWDDEFPSPADVDFVRQGRTLMISWSGTDTRVITSGRFDAEIRQRAEAVKALGAPVLLRWRWEMNRPNLQGSIWSPADYIAAWKHIRAIFTQVGATNAGWVWCPLADDFRASGGPAYYPGDDQVEWLCADVYPGPDYRSFADVSAEFMSWAATHEKPVIIGEYGAEDKAPGQRRQWLTDTTAYFRDHAQIKAVVYFDARHTEAGRDRDFTLVAGTGPMQAFRAMAAEPYFSVKQQGSG